VQVRWHPVICLREEVICAKVYRRTDRQTDGRTDDGRRAIALAHFWNELTKTKINNSIIAILVLIKLQREFYLCTRKVQRTTEDELCVRPPAERVGHHDLAADVAAVLLLPRRVHHTADQGLSLPSSLTLVQRQAGWAWPQ